MFFASSYGTATLLAAGAFLLCLGGATLIFYAVRTRREELARRVDLVVPRLALAGARAEPAFHRAPLAEIPGGLPVRDRREIMRRLAAFHIPATRAMFAFSILRGFSVIGAALFAYLLAARLPALEGQLGLISLLALAAGIGGWFAPVMIVNRLVKSRTAEVAAGLPDALELLVVCVEAGLALEDGLERIVVEMRHSHPPLAEELALTAADLKILPSRDQALANLAERVDVASVRSVVTTLAQTMRYGTPLAQALRTVANEMRNDALLELEERANRLPTLLTLPMMLFIMPTIFLIVGGPAALRLIDTFFR
jgi:tight adherence protein C